MSGKTGSNCVGETAQAAIAGNDRVHRGAGARHASADGSSPRGMLPTMHASARRRVAAGAVRAPRKTKRVKHTHTLGGRLAATIRMARLRAGRAAEEFRMRR